MLPVLISASLLASLIADKKPWITLEANSDQRQPIYYGLTPLELVQGKKAAKKQELHKILHEKGNTLFPKLPEMLKQGKIQIEIWPAYNDYMIPTWTVARWRETKNSPWKWLNINTVSKETSLGDLILPDEKNPKNEDHKKTIFLDFLESDDLYFKPMFGDCVWTNKDGDQTYGAWLDPTLRDSLKTPSDKLPEGALCYLLPQPARFNGEALSYVVTVDKKVSWPQEIHWKEDKKGDFIAKKTPKTISLWPKNLQETYKKDVQIMAGELPVTLKNEKTLSFKRKNSGDPQNELEVFVDYLEERYASLSIPTERQRFMWRGIAQSNLIAKIPSSKTLPPLLLVDHFDTANAEDVYRKEKKRVSAPGADDNSSGSAALLKAGEILKNLKLKRPVWLVHLTGEEFPGDDLGARVLLRDFLSQQKEIFGVIVLDMIGHREPGDGLFQINAGEDEKSLDLARIILNSSQQTVPSWMKPIVRTRFDKFSYFYNTDALFFGEVGYPTVLINEHINRWENYGKPGDHRPGYHRTDDNSAGMDFVYASSLTKLAIEVAAKVSR